MPYPIEFYRAVAEPQLSFKFDVYLPLIAGAGIANPSPFAATLSDLPLNSFDLTQDVEGGRQVGFAGLGATNTITVTFEISQPTPLFAYFDAWDRLIEDPVTGLRGLPAEYKRSMLFILNRGQQVPNVIVRGVGCFPLAGHVNELDTRQTAVATYSRDFWVDRCVRQFG